MQSIIRSDRFRNVLKVVFVLCAAVPADAVARQESTWSRATVALLQDGAAMDAGRAEQLRDAGLDAVVWHGNDGWGEAMELAREAGLKIFLALDGEGQDSIAGRAMASGFHGIVSLGGKPVAAPEDPSFMIVEGDADIERLGPLPGAGAGLEALFARRARSPERPEAAPLALPVAGASADWLLLPGPVAVPESVVGDPAWNTIARFRARHPALADGVHGKLSDSPYAFFRGLRLAKGEEDIVLVIIGAEGKLRLNVSSIFPDDVVLRDAVSGAVAMVSYGQLSTTAPEGGLMLFEEVR